MCLCSVEVGVRSKTGKTASNLQFANFRFLEFDAYSSRFGGVLSIKPKISELDREVLQTTAVVLSYFRLAPLLTSLLRLYSSSLTQPF